MTFEELIKFWQSDYSNQCWKVDFWFVSSVENIKTDKSLYNRIFDVWNFAYKLIFVINFYLYSKRLFMTDTQNFSIYSHTHMTACNWQSCIHQIIVWKMLYYCVLWYWPLFPVYHSSILLWKSLFLGLKYTHTWDKVE